MRKSAYSAAAVLSSVALLSVGAPTVAQAHTPYDMTVCWVNQSIGSSGTYDLEAVADGPAFKTASLDGGDCVHWDVKAGQYKMTVEDMDELVSAVSNMDCPAAYNVESFKITIKRGTGQVSDSYTAYNLAAFQSGQVTTNIRKNRATTITAGMYCSLTP